MELYELKILTVEDEPQVRKMICEILKEAGYQQVCTAGDCKEAREAFRTQAPDCVLLDVMLPDGDGFALRGLGLGADDYIVKPFLPAELVLRVGAVLKRSYAAQAARPWERLRLGETVVDWDSCTARSPRGTCSLTAKECAILRCLAARRGKIVTIDALCRAVWGEDFFGYENTLMVHLRRLRAKLEEDPSHPKWLLTQRGLGYKLAQEDEG